VPASPDRCYGQESPIEIVYNPGIAPLKFEDSDGRATGLLIDVWRLWAERADVEVRFKKAASSEESLDVLRMGRADLHAGLFSA